MTMQHHHHHYHHQRPQQQQNGSSATSNESSRSGRSSPWMRKPLSVVHQQQALEATSTTPCTATPSSSTSSATSLHRHLSVWDLICIGIGSSVGSGIFVLTGQIAAQTTGPLTFVSFALAGLAACLSGTCYAELSGRLPAAGSTYVYAYVCLGELAAVVAASCLSLEYGIAGAAVARSWGDKVLWWMETMGLGSDSSGGGGGGGASNTWFQQQGSMINLPAGLVSILSTLLLLAGVQESKSVTNIFTALKLWLVAFMTIGGFVLFRRSNFTTPVLPYGWQGVWRGATSSFFAYLGYDEVCCVAGEAKDPARTMPLAVLGTLLIVTACYVLSALALTGMVHYTDIHPTSGFPDAFATRHVYWAAQLTSLGELVCLPVVVLVSLMAQPRLALSMAHDGLLPPFFAKVDARGNLFGGTLVCGSAMTLIATFLPFTYLNDLISAGILVAFSMTDSCLVLLRCESPASRPYLLEQCLVIYNASCLLTALLWSHTIWFLPGPFQTILAILLTGLTIASFLYLVRHCPQSAHFGGSILCQPLATHHNNADHGNQHGASDSTTDQHFRTPLVPYLPCLGMAVNWYLYV